MSKNSRRTNPFADLNARAANPINRATLTDPETLQHIHNIIYRLGIIKIWEEFKSKNYNQTRAEMNFYASKKKAFKHTKCT